MILPSLSIPSKIHQIWKESGIDSLEHCLDKKHFLSYQHDIEYHYNSRGYRDQEWPESPQQLQNAIWCIGDSFTVGLGSPVAHTWPSQLAKCTGQRIVNVSMDGASNQWISRTAKKIVDAVNPHNMVIMWSYTHRREHDDQTLQDEQRKLFSVRSYDSTCDWQDFLKCKDQIESVAHNLVQFSIPKFHLEILDLDETWGNVKGCDWPHQAPTTPEELDNLPTQILDELKNLHSNYQSIKDSLLLSASLTKVIPVAQQDIARDGHHFDLITAEWVAKQAMQHLSY